MYKTNKSLSVKFVSIFLSLFFLAAFTSLVVADENYGNVPPDANMMSMMSQESVDLPFDANAYSFLVYNPGGSESSIEDAMEHILGRPLTTSEKRGYVDGVIVEVTPNDLATHDILIVGWNKNGNTTGLHSDDLAAGINGRVILTGHDLDFHTAPPAGYYPQEAAEKMLIQAIDYVLAGDGTGMITLGCTAGFPYLPKQNWDVNAVAGGSEIVTEFTPYGLASGVFDGLEPGNMCNWGQSYHDKFTIMPGSAFVPFELGGSNGDANVTVDRASVYPLKLFKTDDANAGWVKPGDRLTYTINYSYPNNNPNWTITLHNVVLTDYLPAEVNHTNVVPDHNGAYDSNTHKVTWNIGTFNPGDSNSVTVAVTVGNHAASKWLLNTAKITAAEANETTFTRWTPWYQVHNVTKNRWYTTIQAAINNANTDNNDVLVAYPGVYRENVNFGSKVLTLKSTNPADPCVVAQTIISSSVGGEGMAVTVNNNSIINGFTITGGSHGVYCTNGSPIVKNCVIRNNTSAGVYCYYAATITNCTITGNYNAGIQCDNAGQVKILNNLIVNNGYGSGNGYGIYVEYTNPPLIRNNTISGNNCGIVRTGGTADPNISNCIIWDNGNNFSGTFNDVTYCDINNGYDSSKHNIGTDPCFVDVNAENFHLKFGSLCIDAGDPNRTYDSNETDIDHQPRRNGIGRVDIGADEYYGSADLNDDAPDKWNNLL